MREPLDRSTIDAIKTALCDPRAVVERLGLARGMKVNGPRSVHILCPWHSEDTPSCHVWVTGGQLAVKCHGSCGKGGDVLHLIAAAERLDLDGKDFAAVLERGAEMARIAMPTPGGAHGGDGPGYPPIDEVEALWDGAVAVDRCPEASSWLASRGLDVEAIARLGLARSIPAGARLPSWARYNGRPWVATGHRLLVPMLDADGVMRSVRARAVRAIEGSKAVPPTGHRMGGLVMASPPALAMLRGEGGPARLVIAEGEPDFFSWAQRDEAVVGIVGGAWNGAHAERVPDGCLVVVWTDVDTAGEKYARQVAETLAQRARVLRRPLEDTRDANDLLRAGALPLDPAEGARDVGAKDGPEDPASPASVVAYLVARLRAVEAKTRAVEAMRPAVVGWAAGLDELSPEWAELWGELKAGGVALAPWRKAVRTVAERRRREREEAEQARVEEAGADPAASPAARIAYLATQLQRTTTGTPKANAANLLTIFAQDPRWSGRLAYHALREAVVTTSPIEWHPDDAPEVREAGEWTEQDSVRASAWLSRCYELDAGSLAITEAVETIARKRVIDPVRDYLRGLVWDGVVRLPTWLSTYLGAKRGPYTEAIGSRWLVSGVARTMTPGCKVDCVLVLEGKQGGGKSTALRNLCADPSWFYDDDIEIGNAQAAGQALRGKTLIELGELSALSKHELSTTKSFITRQADTYRPSFGRRSRDFPRRCFFAGSTNEDSYLTDEENRRFWPVRCGIIDARAVARDRDQLWAEAVVRFDQGEAWHVDSPELAALCAEEQEQRAKADPWETWVGEWLSRRVGELECRARIMGPERCDCPGCAGVTSAAVLSGALGMEKDKQNTAAEMRCAAVMKRLGWVKRKRVTKAGVRVRPYYPSADAAALADERARTA